MALYPQGKGPDTKQILNQLFKFKHMIKACNLCPLHRPQLVAVSSAGGGRAQKWH